MNSIFNEIVVERRKAIITGVILFAVFCAFLYLASLGPDGKKVPRKPTQVIQLNIPPTATITVLPPELPASTAPSFAQLQSGAALSGAAGNMWRFLRLNPKDYGLFESLDTPGKIIKGICQQPNLPTPQPGTLYRLDTAGILTPISGDPGIQSFKVIE